VPAVKLASSTRVRFHVLTDSERGRLAAGAKCSQQAAGLLAAAVDSVAQLEDTEVRQLALAALDAMDRLQERLQLLDDAHRIADRHRAADLVISEVPASCLAVPLAVGAGAALAQSVGEGN